jgi:hypothetical protein
LDGVEVHEKGRKLWKREELGYREKLDLVIAGIASSMVYEEEGIVDTASVIMSAPHQVGAAALLAFDDIHEGLFFRLIPEYPGRESRLGPDDKVCLSADI